MPYGVLAERGLAMSKPAPTFASVARSVAKGGSPPDWLEMGLKHFANGLGDPRSPDLRHCINQMHEATTVLMKLLPAFELMPFNLKSPSHVNAIRQALPSLEKDLARAGAKARAKRRSSVTREICAAVIVESWTMLHGKAEPRSAKLEQACADYWQACGGKLIDPDNWRRDIMRAVQTNHKWVRQILAWYRTNNK
jgi:hypothetical protein